MTVIFLTLAGVALLGILLGFVIGRDTLGHRLRTAAERQALRQLMRPSVDLQLATIEEIALELNRRPEFVGVVIVPRGTYQVGRGTIRFAKVGVSMAGCDVHQAIDAVNLALESLRELRSIQKRKGGKA